MNSTSGNHLLKVPPGAIEDARKTHNLDKPGRVEDALKILREWILKQNHIIKKDFSDVFLENTLIGCKGSVEKAKKQIDRLCTMKTLLPKFFTKTNVKTELRHISDIVWSIPLPTLTKDHYRILLTKVNNNNFTTESFMEYFQFTITLTEYIKAHDYVNGLMIIEDFRDLNIMDVITRMNTAEVQQFISIIVNGYGARLKAIHILTDSNAIDVFVKILKQIFSEKIGNRIYVQKTLEDLHKVVDKELLPIEYGGSEKYFNKMQEEWIVELSSEKHVEYMRMMNKAGTDETKRHEGTFNEEYMGMPGSFRCLSVD